MEKSAFYLRVLFNRHHKGPVEQATRLLPSLMQQALQKERTSETDIAPAFIKPEDFLYSLHYSWIADAIQNAPEGKQLFYLAALPHSLMMQVAKILNADPPKPLKSPLKEFVQKELTYKILPERHTPYAYLPKSPLDPLLKISKIELIELIDYLGLYDLAGEMKKIVDTKLLKNIHLALNPKEQEFLKSCLHYKDKIQTSRFPLQDWQGDSKDLINRLHKRGLVRLAKALTNQSPDFLWALTRRLDIGRGKRLLSLISTESHPQITTIITEQVLQLLKFLDKGIET